MVRSYGVTLRVEIEFEKRFLPMGFICPHLHVTLQMPRAALDTVYTVHLESTLETVVRIQIGSLRLNHCTYP